MDVDGTLTDGKINIGADGELFKTFNVKDGYGIAVLLPKYNITPVIITGRRSEIVERRASELCITDLFQGVSDKLLQLTKVAEKYGATPDEIVYMGDDLNDLDCIKHCGFSACPCDAVEEVKTNSHYVCNKKSGDGAVREVIDMLINKF